MSSGDVDKLIRQTAERDGTSCLVREEQEPGSSGLAIINLRKKTMAGFNYRGVPSTHAKALRWQPMLVQAEVGNVFMMAGKWNDAFLAEVGDAPYLISAQLEARQRHARLAQATLTVLSLPVKAALEAARDPALVQKLVDQAAAGPAGSYQLLSMIARMASVIPNVVTMERLALGMTSESVEVEEKRDFDVAFTNRIVADPIAVDLAIQLFSRVAGPGPHPALGPGPSGEPGEVVADAAPRPPDEEAG